MLHMALVKCIKQIGAPFLVLTKLLSREVNRHGQSICTIQEHMSSDARKTVLGSDIPGLT